MENKKAWLSIVEASIAVLIVASALAIIMLRSPEESNIDKDIHEMQRLILKQISLNDGLRGEILVGETTNTEIFIEDMVPTSWDFVVKVCEIEDICGMPPLNIKKEVYVDQILISSTLTQYSPKKLKLFVWVEG